MVESLTPTADLEFSSEFDNSVMVTYTIFYMESIPCINCVSVVVADYIGYPKSFRGTFLKEIGVEPGQSRSLYKTCWSLRGVNFLTTVDMLERTGSICILETLSEFCSAAEPAPTFSEDSALLPRSAEPVGVPGAALP